MLVVKVIEGDVPEALQAASVGEAPVEYIAMGEVLGPRPQHDP
jgi:hypothetical protein